VSRLRGLVTCCLSCTTFRVHTTSLGALISHRIGGGAYRGTSLIRKRHPVGPYSRTMPRLLWRSWGGGAVSYQRGTPVPLKWSGGQI